MLAGFKGSGKYERTELGFPLLGDQEVVFIDERKGGEAQIRERGVTRVLVMSPIGWDLVIQRGVGLVRVRPEFGNVV
jgi:hypothetical protein